MSEVNELHNVDHLLNLKKISEVRHILARHLVISKIQIVQH